MSGPSPLSPSLPSLLANALVSAACVRSQLETLVSSSMLKTEGEMHPCQVPVHNAAEVLFKWLIGLALASAWSGHLLRCRSLLAPVQNPASHASLCVCPKDAAETTELIPVSQEQCCVFNPFAGEGWSNADQDMCLQCSKRDSRELGSVPGSDMGLLLLTLQGVDNTVGPHSLGEPLGAPLIQSPLGILPTWIALVLSDGAMNVSMESLLNTSVVS